MSHHKEQGSPAAGDEPIPMLDALCATDHGWATVAARYGVKDTEPPWKVSLYATLECLSAKATLPSLERRHTEDRLGATTYRTVSGADQQLLSLAHILLRRGLLSEEELNGKLRAVRQRLEAG